MWLWLAIIICFLAGAAQAQVAQVQTGEHDEFTRVVVTIPEGAAWQLGRTDVGYALRVPGVERYDLSGFFDLIPQDRVQSVRQNPQLAELTLEVVCPCNADAFLFRPDTLVVDIIDGLPDPASEFEIALDPPTVPLPIPVVQQPERATQPFEVTGSRLLPILIPEDRTIVDALPAAAPPAPEPASETTLPEDPATTESIAALEAAITQSLAQGLTEGALQGARTLPNDTADGTFDDLTTALEGLALPGVAARSGVDPLAVASAAPPDLAQDGRACLPDSYFAVAAWGDDRPFFDQINAARRQLVGEFDIPDTEAVTALARLYVYFGFGREARQTLTLDGVRGQERLYLDALARIMDMDPLPDGLFDAQISCPGPVALWAMLADDDPPFDAAVDRVAVLRTFKTLPLGLQAHLGPRLSDKFIATGDADAALQVLTTAKSQPVPTIETALADATLSEALGEPETAIATVTAIAREDPRATPAAMARFFEEGIDAGLAFDDADFLTADSLRFEASNSPAGTALTAAQVRAYIASDRFTDADLLMNSASDVLDAEITGDLQGEMLLAATDRLTDTPFLEFIWGRPMGSQPAEVQTPVAARLTDLGFPEIATEIMTARASDQALGDQQYERARAALAQGQPEQALIHLRDDMTERGNALRAAAVAAQQAQMTVRQFDAGLSAVPVDQAQEVLQAGASAGNLGSLQQALEQAEPLTLDPVTPLTQSRDLLGRSAETRALLDQLLNQFSTPLDF